MGLGTSIGGWRIIRTMGLRVVQLRPIHGFAAETAAATIIEAASRLGHPGVHDAHDQHRDHGRRRDAPPVGGALGRRRPDRHGLGADDSGLLPAGVDACDSAGFFGARMTPRPRDHVQRITPYEWEAMASDVAAAAGIAESQVVRFDTNTTPWPPVAWERTVLDAPRLPANEYPHPSNEPLRSNLAARLGVSPDQVVVTCGADEALFLIASVYLGPGRLAVVADPAFSMFRVVSEAVGASMLRVPVTMRGTCRATPCWRPCAIHAWAWPGCAARATQPAGFSPMIWCATCSRRRLTC